MLQTNKLDNHQYVHRWLEYKKNLGRIASNTYESYRQEVECVARCIQDAGLTDWLIEDRDTAIKVVGAARKRYTTRKVRQVVSMAKRISEWWVEEGILEANPYSKIPTTKGKYDGVIGLYEPEAIFLLRKVRANAADALAMEIMLSSGIRLAEVCQLRVGYIDLTDKPHDAIENIPCRYCGGSIRLERSQMRIKQRSSRKVYISRIAGELLQRYVDRHSLTSSAPLFCSPPNVDRLFRRAKLLDRIQSVENIRSDLDKFIDVDLDELAERGVDPKFIKALQQKRERERNAKPVNDFAKQPEQKQVVKISPNHSLRHTFACIMYWRNYHGARKNFHATRLMLGHSGDNRITDLYVNDYNYLEDDAVWKKLLVGSPGDWSTLRWNLSVGKNCW